MDMLTGMWACGWFLEIAFVWEVSIGMYVCSLREFLTIRVK